MPWTVDRCVYRYLWICGNNELPRLLTWAAEWNRSYRHMEFIPLVLLRYLIRDLLNEQTPNFQTSKLVDPQLYLPEVVSFIVYEICHNDGGRPQIRSDFVTLADHSKDDMAGQEPLLGANPSLGLTPQDGAVKQTTMLLLAVIES